MSVSNLEYECLTCCLSVCLSVYPAVCLSVCLPCFLSVCPAVCSSVLLSICLLCCLSVCPVVCRCTRGEPIHMARYAVWVHCTYLFRATRSTVTGLCSFQTEPHATPSPHPHHINATPTPYLCHTHTTPFGLSLIICSWATVTSSPAPNQSQ